MKVEQQNQFKPVTITLESQEEVDCLYAIFNHLTLSGEMKFDYIFGRNCYEKLKPYRSNNYHDHLSRISGIIKI